jgi:hypothetical protein
LGYVGAHGPRCEVKTTRTDATSNAGNFAGAWQSDKAKWDATAAFLGESDEIIRKRNTKPRAVAPMSQIPFANE